MKKAVIISMLISLLVGCNTVKKEDSVIVTEIGDLHGTIYLTKNKVFWENPNGDLGPISIDWLKTKTFENKKKYTVHYTIKVDKDTNQKLLDDVMKFVYKNDIWINFKEKK